MKNKDLGVKIGSEEEAYWTRIKNDTANQIKQLKNQLKFTEAVLELATKKAADEEKKFKTQPPAEIG